MWVSIFTLNLKSENKSQQFHRSPLNDGKKHFVLYSRLIHCSLSHVRAEHTWYRDKELASVKVSITSLRITVLLEWFKRVLM